MYNLNNVSELENNNRNVQADIYYMFIDTETSGVPENNYTCWSNCRLIQLGMLVKNRLFETVYEACLTVQYDGTNGTTPEAFNVHGISDNDRISATDGRVVCEEFINVAIRCHVLVSHGNAFDFGVIFRECLLHNIDISCLVGKVVANTKQSEHYRGFHENLHQTVMRINPSWQIYTNELVNDNIRAHNALYDAHLCAELYRCSHHPMMNQPMQNLIEYLNFRRYYEGLNDIRVSIENFRIANNMVSCEQPTQYVIEEQPQDILSTVEYNGPEEESDISWTDNTIQSEEEDYSELYEESEITCEEDDIDISDIVASDYAYDDENTSNDQMTTESYLHSLISSNNRVLNHHAPEDYNI